MRPWRGIAAFALLIALVIVAVAIAAGVGEEPTGGQRGEQPNIIVVMTDDQAVSTLEQGLPNTLEWMSERGTRFNNMIVTTPLCCPSRATLQSGGYGHNNGVLRNNPGYPDLKGKGDVLPVWLDKAGYETALVGKFMNGYGRDDPAEAASPAPGWNEWRETVRPYAYVDFALSVNGDVRDYDDDQYLTDVLTRQAVDIVEENAKDPQPLYMWLSYWAPHAEGVEANDVNGRCRGSAVPSQDDVETLAAVTPPQPGAYNEADVSDKPRAVRRRPRLQTGGEDLVAENFACHVASLRAVDRGFEKLVDALERVGELDNTVLIVYSDNGFVHGEHRITNGKSLPYEPAIKVPLMVSAPEGLLDGEQVPEVDLPVANIDLAPTILDLADAAPCRQRDKCRTLDGRSFTPLLVGRDGEWPSNRTLLIEAAEGQPCPFTGVRTDRYVYVEYGVAKGPCDPDERELYDLADDPFELDNLLATEPEAVAAEADALAATLAELRDCAGIDGRDPEPPSGHYCE